MQTATSTGSPDTGWSPSRRSRIAAIIGGLGGALAISGAILSWVSVHAKKATTSVHGTTFTIGKLTLGCGIVLVLCAAGWIAISSPRARAALAVGALAAGAAVVISIGTGMATKTFFDQAVTHVSHQKQHKHRQGSSPTPSAQGAVYMAGSTAASLGEHPFVAEATAGKKKKGKRTVTSTLQPGLFIALGGGILGVVAGAWALLGGGSPAPAPVPAADAAPPALPATEPVSTPLPPAPVEPTPGGSGPPDEPTEVIEAPVTRPAHPPGAP